MPQHRRTGGANSKMKKYPRIIDYLQKTNKPVYELIDSVAMHGSLSPRRGGGITFLVPDKKLIAEINKVLESSEPEVATDIISSLIITDYLGSTQDFKNKQSNIPTLIGKKLVVKSVSAKDVELEGGGKLTLDAKFQPFDRSGNAKRGNMAVWNLSGKVDYEKAPAIDHSSKPAVSGSGHKSGKFRGGAQHSNIDLKIQEIIRKELEQVQSRPIYEKRESCMLNAVVNKLREWGKEDCRYKCAMELIPGHPIPAFQMLFCNRLIFSVEDLGEIDDSNGVGQNVSALQDMLEEFHQSAETAERAKNLQKFREEFIHSKFDPKKFKEIYNKLETDNKLVYNSVTYVENFYHKELFEKFKSHRGLKALIDQYYLQAFQRIEEMNGQSENPQEQCTILRDFLHDVGTVYKNFTRVTRNMFTDPDDFQVRGSIILEVYKNFLDNYAFCMPYKVSRSGSYAYTGRGEDDEEESQIEGEIADKKPELTDECIEQLKNYLKAHDGKFPAELGDVLGEQ